MECLNVDEKKLIFETEKINRKNPRKLKNSVEVGSEVGFSLVE